MAGENVEAVRRWLEPAMSSDPDEIRAAAGEFCDPDFDYYPTRKFPEARPCHGLEEFCRFLVRFREPWSRFEWTINELIEIGDDRVLGCLTMRTEGRESAMSLEGGIFPCYWLRQGRCFRQEDHLTLGGALRALGLKGETLEAAGLRAPTNLDLVRSIYAAWERGDFSSAEWAHPEIDYVFADGPTPGSWTGPAGMAEGWRDFLSAWEEYRAEVEEYRELDDERVLVFVRWHGRGKTSGLDVEQLRAKGAHLLHVRGGKVTKSVAYFDRERALADLGLQSETAER
jgi:ketosteroid isomerase-like protein